MKNKVNPDSIDENRNVNLAYTKSKESTSACVCNFGESETRLLKNQSHTKRQTN